MKKAILFFIVVFTTQASISQNFNALANYQFQTVESYSTEKNNVLLCANYLFNNPANKNEANRLTSIQYIMKWMEGTPDYTFDIGPEAIELTKGNDKLLMLYLAAMSKAVLDNKETSLNKKQILEKSQEILVDYCANPDNKIKPSKKIKKLIKKRKS